MATRPANAGASETGGHRAIRPERAGHREKPAITGLSWLPAAVVLAGVAAGLLIAWQGSTYAGRGAGLVGCALLLAALARLVLPARYTDLLSARGKTFDVLAFTVLGAAVLAVAISLP
jgi:Protein of unknown function (DUF3017)